MRLTDKTSGFEDVEIPLLHSLNVGLATTDNPNS